MLAEGQLPAATAVIAAELFGLQVLERRIQGLKLNFTAFIAASGLLISENKVQPA